MIEQFTAGLDLEGFRSNPMVVAAVERKLQIISEAATRLGGEAEKRIADQPWRDIRGIGNHLRHAYERIDLDAIRAAVTEDLPPHKAAVLRELAPVRPKRRSDQPGSLRRTSRSPEESLTRLPGRCRPACTWGRRERNRGGTPDQFPASRSARSITITDTGSLRGSSLRPACFVRASKSVRPPSRSINRRGVQVSFSSYVPVMPV